MNRKQKKIKKEPVFCGQDLRELIGFRVVDVTSNKLDCHVKMVFEDDFGNGKKLYFNDGILDGECLKLASIPRNS